MLHTLGISITDSSQPSCYNQSKPFRPLNNWTERKLRALVLGANFEEKGRLFKRIAFHVRSHAELAKPLTCIQDIRNEGRVMGNCLARGAYDQDALTGRLALFSLISSDTRATLSLGLRQVGLKEILDQVGG